MLNIPPRSWETGPPVLGVTPSIKIGTCLYMKSLTGRSEDAPVSKFAILGCNIEDGVVVVSIGLLRFELNFSILSNSISLVSLYSVIC